MTLIVPQHTRPFVALHGGCVVFCTILFLILWDCIDIKHKHQKPSKHIKYYSILSIIMYTISSCIMLFYFIFYPLYDFAGKFPDHIFQMSWGIFWRLGQAFLYLLFLERLNHSFKHTKYASSNRTFCIFYIGISIFIISYIIKTSIYCYLYNTNHDEDTDSLYAIVGDIDMGITQIIDLSLSIGIMTLFLNKLYQLNVDLTDSRLINNNNNQNNPKPVMQYYQPPSRSKNIAINASIYSDASQAASRQDLIANNSEASIRSQSLSNLRKQRRKLTLNQRQKTVIGIMAKITLLSGIALASSQIVLFLGGALYLTELIPKYKNWSVILWNIKMGYFAINAVIISSSIVLQFDFSYKYYKRCCKIDKMCVKCCTWSTKKKITKLSSSSISYDNIISENLSSPKYDSGYDIAADNYSFN